MSSRRRRTRRNRKTPGLNAARVAAVLLALTLIALLAGSLTAFAVVQTWLEDLPDYESPEAFEVAQTTRIWSADGVLLARLYLENRTVVPMSEISTDLANAIVATEDERFYEHHGIDYLGIARAIVIDVVAGSLDEGASTITQQYVDNTLLRDERTSRTFEYKAREAFLAMELEKRKSKEEILGLYLNTIYLGEGAYGAQAASKTYFSKDASELTLAEAALLAGLAQAPSRLSPYDNPDGALVRRNLVLDRMLSNEFITQEQHDLAVETPIDPKRAAEPEQGVYRAHYFVAHVKKLLQQEFSQALVFQGGLDVYTSIDTRIQKMAEDSVEGHLGQPGDPDVALVSIDPRDGSIKAMYGGSDYSTNKFNLATQGSRQPGSSFKTFVLVTALEEGMPPYRYIDGSSPAHIPSNPPWVVSNSGGGGGKMTLESGTRGSVNTVFARLIWDLNDDEESGAEKVSETARRMGITSEIPPYPSIALGSQNVTVLEMASAYGTLATNGVHFEPMAITKVVDPHGEIVFEAKPDGVRAVEPEIAYAATSVLKGVITGGTARAANIGRPAAGKTGTSQNYRDAWFCGYTPQLSTAVWVGYYDREEPMRSVRGMRGFGGTLAAPIWAAFNKKALANEPKLDFEKQDKPKYTWKSEWAAFDETLDLVGMTKAEATKAGLEAGFRVSFVEIWDATVPVGRIVSQSPKPGDNIKGGGTITVKISKGAQPAPKPEPKPDPPPPTPDTTPTP